MLFRYEPPDVHKVTKLFELLYPTLHSFGLGIQSVSANQDNVPYVTKYFCNSLIRKVSKSSFE